MIKGRRFSSGFSLIEVIIAILLLSFIFMYTFQLFTSGLRTYKESVKKTMVVKLTKSKFEEIFAAQRYTVNWDYNPRSGNFGYLNPGAAPGTGQKTLNYSDFTFQVNIDPNPTLPSGMASNAGIKKVTVTVTGPLNNNPKTTVMTGYLGAVPTPEENKSVGSAGSKWYEVPNEGYFPDPEFFKPPPPPRTINEQVIFLTWSGSPHLKETVALGAPVINGMKPQTKIIFSGWLF